MKTQYSRKLETKELREKAEELLKHKTPKENISRSNAEALKLLHELEVHQIELELQNEELIEAKRMADEARDKYEELYDHAPTGYLSLSQEGKIIELNFAAANILGKERTYLTGKSLSKFISSDTQGAFERMFKDIKNSEVGLSCEVRIFAESNQSKYVSIDCNVKAANRPYLLALVDISDRVMAEKKIIEISKNWQTTFDAIQDPIFLLKVNHEIINLNQAGLELLNTTKEQVIGNKCYEILNNTFDDLKDCPCTKSLIKRKVVVVEHSKGHEAYELTVCPVFNYQNEIQAFTLIIKNVTAKKQNDYALIHAKEKAEESDRLKSAFLANMSHEIRTPMNGIIGFADLLKTPSLSEKDQQKFVNVIEKSGERMLKLINDLIDISKIESGQTEVKLTQVNIPELLNYFFTFFNNEAKTKNIELIYNPQSELNNDNIFTDKEKFAAIFINLLKNAIKYTYEGTIEFGYTLIGSEEKEIQFYVKDTGIGIAANRQKSVFDRFVQVEQKTNRINEGAGLGLSICKAYVEMLDGKLWLSSQPGKGSAFYFTLPYQTNLKLETPISKQVEVSEASNYDFHDLKVLIVEDNRYAEMYLWEILKSRAKRIHYAQDGKHAVEFLKANTDVDLILMDVKMPIMDGYTATREIRKFNKEVIIISQTAYALTGEREKALAAGCNDYIAKPIKEDLLLSMISEHMINRPTHPKN